MNKKELYSAIIELNKGYELPEGYEAALSALTIPGVGGGKDVTDYTVFNEEDEVTYIFCKLHQKWEPVADEEGEPLFREDAKGKNGYRRECMESDASYKEIAKALKASEKSIMTDLLDGEITSEDAKAALAELGDVRSQIPARADGLGTDEKPEA